MLPAPAPSPPSVVATAVTSSPASSRPTGVHRGISFLRNLHLHHSASESDPPRADARPRNRPRALTQPASPAFASPSQPLPDPRPNSLSRRQTTDQLQAQPPASEPPPTSPPQAMTRTRSETAQPQLQVRNNTGPTPTSTPGPVTTPATENGAGAEGAGAVKHLPSIRFIPHQDPRAGRPSLIFPTINRTLPDEAAIIRVGRYSERDTAPEITPSGPSAAAVGFKSKVVSRKHCELWCKDGSWYIKDVKSSSGTFLNHIRLSQPNVESKPFRIKDGDIIQLGIDFRGGEEMIFRCVKIRVECNRGWQQGLNTFNKQTHQRLRNLAKNKKDVSDTASTHTSECAICLMSIAPCQSLFVAPCSHVWHYKCIRPILNGPTWPNFLCPNCRAVADLEEDVDDTGEFEDWGDDDEHPNGTVEAQIEAERANNRLTARSSAASVHGNGNDSDGGVGLTGLEQQITNIDINGAEPSNGIAGQDVPQTPDRHLTPPTSSVTQPVTINVSGANEFTGLSPLYPAVNDGLTPDRVADGPMTPRNDAGPFVLDGSAGRAAGARMRDGSPADSASDSGSSGARSNEEAPSLPPVRFD